MRRAVLIHNPAAGRGRRARALAGILDGARQILAGGGYRIELAATSRPGEATELARAAAEAGVEAVFAYGGDGTLRETARGLLGTRVPVGFLPGGTANVMTLALGLPTGTLAAAAALAEAEPRELDVGLCGKEPFLMQASCGLDAEVLARLPPGLKRGLGRASVGLTALAVLPAYRFPEIALTVDGEPERASFAAVCNIPFYGGRWRLVPEARPDDGRLDLMLFRGRGRLGAVGLARDLFLGRGRHLGRRDVLVRPIERVTLEGPVGLAVQIDGDVHPASPPLEIRLAPIRLRALAPRGAG